MSFGEHLEELRKVLVRAMIGVAIGCVFGFLVAEKVVKLLQNPLQKAITNFHIAEGKQHLIKDTGWLEPDLKPWLDEEKRVPETAYVDPGELVRALRSVSPDFLESVNLAPYQFRPQQFDASMLPKMCKMWSTGKSDHAQLRVQQQYLWSLLTTAEQSVVRRIGDSQSATPEQNIQMADILNRLSTMREINQAPAYSKLLEKSGSSFWDFLMPGEPSALPIMKQQLDKEFDTDLSRRINRNLIAGSFGESFGDVRMDLVPLTIWQSAEFQSQSLGATESFMIWIKAGVVTGLLIASPWVFLQLWSFVASGLYPREQKYVYIFLPISLFLFFAGASLAFFFVFEPVLNFLFSFNARMGISPQPRINDWLSFVLFLPLGFGIAFQLPLVMLFMNRINLFSVEDYLSKWRVAVLIIFALSMLLTPADPVSMVMLAIPLTGLYFLGVGLCKWLPGSTNPYGEQGI